MRRLSRHKDRQNTNLCNIVITKIPVFSVKPCSFNPEEVTQLDLLNIMGTITFIHLFQLTNWHTNGSEAFGSIRPASDFTSLLIV